MYAIFFVVVAAAGHYPAFLGGLPGRESQYTIKGLQRLFLLGLRPT